MKSHRQSHPPYSFAIALAAGMFVGVGLTIWLAPRLASELRERITDSAKRYRPARIQSLCAGQQSLR